MVVFINILLVFFFVVAVGFIVYSISKADFDDFSSFLSTHQEATVHNIEEFYFDNTRRQSSIDDGRCGFVQPPILTHFVNGGETAYHEKWPWHVHMRVINGTEVNDLTNSDEKPSECGGTILNENFIITTAECLANVIKRPSIFILNKQNLTDSRLYVKLQYKKIIIHPNYQEFNNDRIGYSVNDLALIKLSDNENENLHKSGPCLPTKGANITIKSICHILGFGKVHSNDTRDVRGSVDAKVRIKTDRVCQEMLNNMINYDNKTMICAGGTRFTPANSCYGDGGSPLICKVYNLKFRAPQWFLIGITSFGPAGCLRLSSSIYTKVSAYQDWIVQVMQSER